MKIELLDSRRLTGPNLFWDWPGAVLDIAISGIPADLVISAWAEEVTRLMEAVGWEPENITSRKFDGGASPVSYTHLTLPTNTNACSARGWPER